MQYTPNVDVATWLDNTRGNMSRQAFITLILRKEMSQMKETQTTKESHEQVCLVNGAFVAPSQI